MSRVTKGDGPQGGGSEVVYEKRSSLEIGETQSGPVRTLLLFSLPPRTLSVSVPSPLPEAQGLSSNKVSLAEVWSKNPGSDVGGWKRGSGVTL